MTRWVMVHNREKETDSGTGVCSRKEKESTSRWSQCAGEMHRVQEQSELHDSAAETYFPRIRYSFLYNVSKNKTCARALSQ